ncbi:uncharacterized protein [Watersipora subatra]|uniref:uncharacterized protein n=1 Tax=Watersipora subatra TaxID=2589382 RepID=UPI00355BB1C0
MKGLTVVVALTLAYVASVNAAVFLGDFDECSCNGNNTIILSADSCHQITCKEDGNGTFGIFESCGVVDIQLTPEQIRQGCVVIERTVTASVRYPDCCGKFVECPEEWHTGYRKAERKFFRRFFNGSAITGY